MLRADAELTARGLVVDDILGRDGSSVVYRARDTRLERLVAIKMAPAGPMSGVVQRRFAREVLVAAALRHPNIMPVFESGVLADGRGYLVMPLATGRPLSELICEGPLTVHDAVRFTREIAEALQFLHNSGFVHRDVKPANVLIESGHAVLTDFGLAVPLRPGVRESSRRLTDGRDGATSAPEVHADTSRHAEREAAGGTIPYMSVEALLGDGQPNPQYDIFALGITLYEMLTGELPLRFVSVRQFAAQRATVPMPDIRSLRPDCPEALDAVARRCAALLPAARFASAGLVAATLDGIELRAAGSGRAQIRRPRRAWTIALVIVGLLMVGGFGWYTEVRASDLDPHRVVVADLANDTGDSTLAGLATLAGDFITRALSRNRELSVVNATVSLPSRQQRLLPVSDSGMARQTRALVKATSAGLVVTGAILRAGPALDIIAEVTDTRSGRIVGVAGPTRVAPAAPDSALRTLADSLAAAVTRRFVPDVSP